MAYLVFTVNGRELGRRALDAPLVIGRAQECDVCIHDILLSRRHCRVEPEGGKWAVADLQSKNGTRACGQIISRYILKDGELIRIGKATVTYHAGRYSPSHAADKFKPSRRAADPREALASTVSGFDYLKSQAEELKRLDSQTRQDDSPSANRFGPLPTPQPSPPEPAAYQSEGIYSFLNELASSSWDSIYMNASRPLPSRTAPRPLVLNGRHPRRRNASPVDMSLQVGGGLMSQTVTPPVPAVPPANAVAEVLRSRPVSLSHRRPFARKAVMSVARGLAAVGQTVMVVGVGYLLSRM